MVCKMKKVVYIIFAAVVLGLVVINLSCFEKRRCLRTMQEDYSFIIGKKVDYSFVDSLQVIPKSGSDYILSIVSPTCEDCYVKMNKWTKLVAQNPILRDKLVFIVVGYEFERLNEVIPANKELHFIFDYENQLFQENPFLLQSQTYFIENDTIVLCGEPLLNRMEMNLFMDYIND